MASTQQLTPKRTLSRKENVVSASDLMPVSSFLCPITTRIMRDPVITIGDGHSYERAAIQVQHGRGDRSRQRTNHQITTTTTAHHHHCHRHRHRHRRRHRHHHL